AHRSNQVPVCTQTCECRSLAFSNGKGRNCRVVIQSINHPSTLLAYLSVVKSTICLVSAFAQYHLGNASVLPTAPLPWPDERTDLARGRQLLPLLAIKDKSLPLPRIQIRYNHSFNNQSFSEWQITPCQNIPNRFKRKKWWVLIRPPRLKRLPAGALPLTCRK